MFPAPIIMTLIWVWYEKAVQYFAGIPSPLGSLHWCKVSRNSCHSEISRIHLSSYLLFLQAHYSSYPLLVPWPSSLLFHIARRFCRICLRADRTGIKESEGKTANEQMSFSIMVFKHWWASCKSLSNCCPSLCKAIRLQMFLNSMLS